MIWKCGDCFPAFSQLFPTQNAAPSIRHGDCSTAHQRRLAELPQLLQNVPQVVHRRERHAVLGAQLPLFGLQASALQRLRLREGAALLQHPGEPQPWIATGSRKVSTAPWRREGTFLTICGAVAYFWIQISGEKTRFRDSNCFDFTWTVAVGYTDWCYLMLVVNTVAYCNLQLSLLRLCGISGCKSLVTRQYSSWLNKFNKYMFANVLVSLEGLRSAPIQCQKRFVVLRAQSFGCGICTAPQPWSMMMPITWLCLSQSSAVVNHVTNMEDKSSSREWPTIRKIVKVWDGSRLQSEAGYRAAIHGPCFAGSSTIYMFLRVRVGEARFFEIGRRLS